MCIICYIPTGAELPGLETFERMNKANPDGAGFMYADGRNVHIHKGYYNASILYADIVDIRKKHPRAPIVAHFRISTQGGTPPELTHPFPVCGSYERMRRLDDICNIGVAHNGIIHEYSAPYTYGARKTQKLDYNDTMTFIRDFMNPLLRGREKWYNAPDGNALRVAFEHVSGSRLAIMSGGGHVELIGNYHTDNGCYYSNDSYKPPRPHVYGGSGWTYNAGTGWTQHTPRTAWGTCAGDCSRCDNYDCIEWDGRDAPTYNPAQYPDIADGNDGNDNEGGNGGGQ